jgi:hypothetical protein
VHITPTNCVWLHKITSCSKSGRGGTENNGVHFAPKEDAMVIQLGVVCTGNVHVKEFLKKVDELIYGGHALPIQHNLQLQSQGDVGVDYREEEGKVSY